MEIDTNTPIIVRPLRQVTYDQAYQNMVNFVSQRTTDTLDEIHFYEVTEPIYTIGKNADQSFSTQVPTLQQERGGLITLHAPGQLITCVMLDLRRRPIKVFNFEKKLQQILLHATTNLGIKDACIDLENPGVYVSLEPKIKIGSLGFKILQYRYTAFGFSLNVDMDLSHWDKITPCGIPNVKMTDLKSQGVNVTMTEVVNQIINSISQIFPATIIVE
jgi:lipoyl(octanoyl) transferase